MPGNTCTCTCKCNADVIDLTADSDEEPIESSRNNSEDIRRRNHQSRRSRKSNDIEVTKATLQTSCTICLRKFEKIKTEGGHLVALQCGHVFCLACIEMTARTRGKRKTNGKTYIHCPNCRTKSYHHLYLQL